MDITTLVHCYMPHGCSMQPKCTNWLVQQPHGLKIHSEQLWAGSGPLRKISTAITVGMLYAVFKHTQKIKPPEFFHVFFYHFKTQYMYVHTCVLVCPDIYSPMVNLSFTYRGCIYWAGHAQISLVLDYSLGILMLPTQTWNIWHTRSCLFSLFRTAEGWVPYCTTTEWGETQF